jgi:hypothetical protein
MAPVRLRRTAGRSSRNGGGLNAAARQQLSELAGFEHLADDIATADELTFDLELRHCRPVGERLDPLAERRVGDTSISLNLAPKWLSTCTTTLEKPHCGKTGVPFRNRTTSWSLISRSMRSCTESFIASISYQWSLPTGARFSNLSCHCERRSDEGISELHSAIWSARLLRFARNDDRTRYNDIGASASSGSFPRHRAAGPCRKRSRRRQRRWATRKCRARPNAPYCRAAAP